MARLVLIASLLAASAHAQTVSPPAEEVLFVKRELFPFDAQLETTVYKPAGTGPWPMLVLNHGQRDFGDHKLQPRYQPVETARFFLERGYLVVVPMRQGFARSGGVYAFNCDHESYARRYAGDISAVVRHFVATGEARREQVLVAGQSNGGFVLLGYGAESEKDDVRPRALINFAGGFNSNVTACDWRTGMIEAARIFGAATHLPALWLYAEDDAIFPPSVSRPYFAAYREGNTEAEFKLYPRGGHGMSNTRSGRQAWGPDVEAFLERVGLPSAVIAPQ